MASDHPQRLAESEARAAKLVTDNARLQQEMAMARDLSPTDRTTPEVALVELKAGNTRLVAGKRIRSRLSRQNPELRTTLPKGQALFTVILTCSDNRLANTLLFDQEMDRLFSVREPGNSPDIQSLASLEYTLEHLGTRLVVILGHTRCRARQAAYDAHGKPLPGLPARRHGEIAGDDTR